MGVAYNPPASQQGVQATGASTAQTITEEFSQTLVNVHRYKDLVSGNDWTAAIEAAWAYARSRVFQYSNTYSFVSGVTGGLYFPPGKYLYNGTGLTINQNSQSIALVGAPGTVVIELGASSRLVDTGASFQLGGVYWHGVSTYGGLGAFKYGLTTSGTPVQQKVFSHSHFSAYTECAIGSLSSDCGGWHIDHCQFIGDSASNCIGVALNGQNTNSSIRDCYFMQNLYHVRLANGGNRCRIENNGFFLMATQAGATDIHLVPDPSDATTAGVGLCIVNNKHGNENISPTDKRILIANLDTSSGGDFTTQPHSTSDTSGSVRGVQFVGNTVENNATVRDSMEYILSYCRGVQDLWIDGTLFEIDPSPITKFPAGPPSTQNSGSSIVNLRKSDCTTGFRTLGDNIAVVLDPLGVAPPHESPNYFGMQEAWELAEVAVADVTAWGTLTNVTRASVAGPDGAPSSLLTGRAVELTFANSGGIYQESGSYWTLAGAGIATYEPIWVEIPVARSSVNPLGLVTLYIYDNTTGRLFWHRQFRLPLVSGVWWSMRWQMPALYVSNSMCFRIGTAEAISGSKDRLIVGQPRIYRARSPVPLPRVGRLCNGYFWLDSTGNFRVSATAPSNYDIDGVVAGNQT